MWRAATSTIASAWSRAWSCAFAAPAPSARSSPPPRAPDRAAGNNALEIGDEVAERLWHSEHAFAGDDRLDTPAHRGQERGPMAAVRWPIFDQVDPIGRIKAERWFNGREHQCVL